MALLIFPAVADAQTEQGLTWLSSQRVGGVTEISGTVCNLIIMSNYPRVDFCMYWPNLY